MRLARFRLPACLSTAVVVFLGVAGFATGPVSGQEGKARTSPAQVDRAQELMRREAEANAKQRDAMLERLRRLGAPPADAGVVAPPRIEMRAVPAPQAPVRVNGPLIAIEEVAAEDDSDENAPRQQIRVYTEQAFDVYVLGAGNIDQVRSRFESVLKLRIEAAARTRPLTREQREKLELAGRGDIKRQFADIEAKRKEFEGLRRDFQKASEFLREISRVRAFQSMPFGEGSLFAKVLATIDRRTIESSRSPRGDRLLPGSALAVRDALARADVVVIARNVRTVSVIDNRDLAIHCATTDIERPLKGNVVKGKLLLNAVPVARLEWLPPEDVDQDYLLFIERSEGDGLRFHRVIKMLPSDDPSARSVVELLTR